VSEARRPEFERFELRVGDVLVSLDRPVISSGVKAAVVRETDVPSLLLQRVGRVLTHDLGLDSEYLFLWLQSPLFAAAIDPGRSNGVPHVSPKDLERVPFERPSMTTQKTMVERGRRLLSTQRRLDFLWRQTAAESDALMRSFLGIAFA
jgi:type I restriction enzyme S subunit